jgi:hypothetical protein
VLVVVAYCRQELGDVVVVEAVAHPPALALADHESELTQDSELLRDGARAHLHDGRELLHAALPVQEGEQEAHPTLGCEDAHRLGYLKGFLSLQGPVRRAVLERVRHIDAD